MSKGTCQKKCVENSTLRGGPDWIIFKKLKNKVVFKMHFNTFQAILDHVFSTLLGGYPNAF